MTSADVPNSANLRVARIFFPNPIAQQECPVSRDTKT
jgi:hypothetical protein